MECAPVVKKNKWGKVKEEENLNLTNNAMEMSPTGSNDSGSQDDEFKRQISITDCDSPKRMSVRSELTDFSRHVTSF